MCVCVSFDVRTLEAFFGRGGNDRWVYYYTQPVDARVIDQQQGGCNTHNSCFIIFPRNVNA